MNQSLPNYCLFFNTCAYLFFQFFTFGVKGKREVNFFSNLLKHNWHVTLCKLKYTVKLFDISTYCKMLTTVKLANISITSYRICVCMCGVNFENLFLWSVSNKQFSTACYSHHVLQSNPKTYFITGSLHLLTTFPHFLASTPCHWQPPSCSLFLWACFSFS